MQRSTIKSIVALALTGAGSALVLGFQTTGDSLLTPSGQATSGSSTGGSSTGGSSTGSGSSSTGGGSNSTSSGKYADGTWTGAAISEPWGSFEVQAVVSGGSITTITVVEEPTDRHSTRINNVAVPILTASAMASQNANVDLVSGATWTSDSYAQSLQSALDQAVKAS